MRLLHISRDPSQLEVVDFSEQSIPPYAVLSHPWYDDPCPESSLFVLDRGLQKQLYIREELLGAFEEALNRGIDFVWVDSCCIDRSSSAELQEAVNGARRRLERATFCFAYLNDLPTDQMDLGQDTLSKCSYWKQASTLPELILPREVEFFDQGWNHRGSKIAQPLLGIISRITNIHATLLLDGRKISSIALAVRISWFIDRVARREEDVVYSLAALTDVALPVLYGIGLEAAFLRFQEEILRNTQDGSILAWRSSNIETVRGLLAISPSEFRHFAAVSEPSGQEPWHFDGRIQFSSKGIQIQSQVTEDEATVLHIGQEPNGGDSVGVYIRHWNELYLRVEPSSLSRNVASGTVSTFDMFRNIDSYTLTKIGASTSLVARASPTKDWTAHILPSRPARPQAVTHFRSISDPSLNVPKVAGVKRQRSQQSIVVPDDDDDDSSISDDDSSSTPESSDEESSINGGSSRQDDDDDASSSSSDEDTEELSDVVNEFKSHHQELLEFSFQKARDWVDDACYIVPPNGNLPPRKRARTSDWEPHQEVDEDEPDWIKLYRIDGYLKLACPFYINQPERHGRCLLLDDLQSIDDVIKHLHNHHTEPPYCPICRGTFDELQERDDHIRARTCEPNSTRIINGIDQYQKNKLRKRDKSDLSEEKRWRRIYKFLFPNTELHRSIYLKKGAERTISLLRDYWTRQGNNCVSEFMKAKTLGADGKSDDERVLSSLRKSLLDDLLKLSLEEQR